MLSPTSDTIRLFLHVLAASVWVGGQIVLGGLVPRLRATFPESTKVAAQAFGRIAWPAFVVVVATGIWSIVDIGVSDTSTDYQVTIFVHVTMAALTGVSAAVHSLGRSKLALALGGALGLLTALAALFTGLLLQSGS